MSNSLHCIDLSSDMRIDQRGWVVNPFQIAGITGIRPANVHLVSCEPDTERGNHVHPGIHEWILLVSGTVSVRWADTHDRDAGVTLKTRERIVIGPAIVSIPPHVAHTIRNIDRCTVYLLAFNDAAEGLVETLSVALSQE